MTPFIGSIPEKDVDGNVYNTMTVYSPQGAISSSIDPN